MGFKEDIMEAVAQIFKEQWATRDGQTVPEADDLKLSNDAVKLSGVVLYADMSASTELVNKQKSHFAAEVYKAYLHCAAKIINLEGGSITAYDGDRIMAVFIGDSKNSTAVRTALKINYARIYIVNPAIKAQYPQSDYELKHVVGIASSELFIARTGVRGANDLVWVGNAANYAAKLCSLSNTHATRITKEVYDMLNKDSKYDKSGNDMWELANWTDTGKDIYRSNHWWSL
jgi:class 3 adenylate cyclase